MSEVRLDAGAASRMAGALTDAASGLGDTGSSAPTGVDAGEWSGVVAALIRSALEPAAAIVDGLEGAAGAVTAAGRGIDLTDEAQVAAYADQQKKGIQP